MEAGWATAPCTACQTVLNEGPEKPVVNPRTVRHLKETARRVMRVERRAVLMTGWEPPHPVAAGLLCGPHTTKADAQRKSCFGLEELAVSLQQTVQDVLDAPRQSSRSDLS